MHAGQGPNTSRFDVRIVQIADEKIAFRLLAACQSGYSRVR